MYAIVFDFDTDKLRQLYPNPSWNNANNDVRNYLSARGFDWKQGSTFSVTKASMRCGASASCRKWRRNIRGLRRL